jgi:spore germination cell wall hydrolase CwlJ-like protein
LAYADFVSREPFARANRLSGNHRLANCPDLTFYEHRHLPLSGFIFTWRKVITANEKDRDILARTLWGEARGESLDGQIAVAWTFRKRVNDGKPKSW